MKIGGIVAIGVVVVATLYGVSVSNSLVSSDENYSQRVAQVQNVLQRQAELIPNLVESVKGYAKYEQDTFTQVAEARSKAGGIVNVDPSKIAASPELQKQIMEASQTMGAAMSRLLALNEKYPELKADKAFQDLRTEMTGSINRVTQERRQVQLAAQQYNLKVRQFPSSLVASIRGFTAKPYYEADATSQRAPTVKF